MINWLFASVGCLNRGNTVIIIQNVWLNHLYVKFHGFFMIITIKCHVGCHMFVIVSLGSVIA